MVRVAANQGPLDVEGEFCDWGEPRMRSLVVKSEINLSKSGIVRGG